MEDKPNYKVERLNTTNKGYDCMVWSLAIVTYCATELGRVNNYKQFFHKFEFIIPSFVWWESDGDLSER